MRSVLVGLMVLSGGVFVPAKVPAVPTVPAPDLVEHLRGRGGGTAPQPRQAGHAQLCVDIQQLIQPGRARRHKKRCQPVVGLRPCPVASSGDPPGQCVHRRTNDPFIAKPVACELEQHTGRVMLQRPSEQERVELLAIAGARRSPAQPGEHERPVITPLTARKGSATAARSKNQMPSGNHRPSARRPPARDASCRHRPRPSTSPADARGLPPEYRRSRTRAQMKLVISRAARRSAATSRSPRRIGVRGPDGAQA